MEAQKKNRQSPAFRSFQNMYSTIPLQIPTVGAYEFQSVASTHTSEEPLRFEDMSPEEHVAFLQEQRRIMEQIESWL
jgi:hypothetical protein